MTSRCRECSAPIRWGTTERGKKIPLDEKPVRRDVGLPEPNVKGLYALDDRRFQGIRSATPDDAFEDLFVSHFATCPERRSSHAKRS